MLVRQCAAVLVLLVPLVACQSEVTTPSEPSATITLRLTGAETQENAAVSGLPQSGGVLRVP